MIVLDSSFLVSLYCVQDSNHSKARELAQKNSKAQMLLTDIILHESLTVINYRAGIEAARLAYEKLCDNNQIQLYSPKEWQMSGILSLFFKTKKLSVADCSVLYFCKTLKSDSLCFDKGILSLLKSEKV